MCPHDCLAWLLIHMPLLKIRNNFFQTSPCSWFIKTANCKARLRVDGCIVWNAYNTVFGSKRSAICAQAVYFLHSTNNNLFIVGERPLNFDNLGNFMESAVGTDVSKNSKPKLVQPFGSFLSHLDDRRTLPEILSWKLLVTRSNVCMTMTAADSQVIICQSAILARFRARAR